MSHIVTIKCKITDPMAVSNACRRLHLAEAFQGTARLFSGEASGLVVQLPGWQYPAVIDTSLGTINYDNFNGQWGDQKEMDRLLQAYAVERAKLEARKKGYSVHEETLQDGSIKIQILEAI